MREVSQSELAELTGKAWRTIRKLLDEAGIEPRREGAANLYDAPEALQAIYLGTNADELDGHKERARRDKEMADKLALENAVRRGELVLVSKIRQLWGGVISSARARLIQLPDAIGQFCDARYAPIIAAESRKRVHEALTELAEGGFVDVGAAALADSERVGGLEPKAIERGERRTGSVAN